MTILQTVQERLQSLGRALMLPIAVLPIAGLILRVGQPDLLDVPFIAAAGSAIFGHLGILFAIGVAVGLARENNGAAGLAGAVCFVVLMEGAKVLMPLAREMPPAALDPTISDALVSIWKEKELAKLNVPAGIISGLAAGYFYNRFYTVRLPEYLSFFAGRRFVPIVCGLFGIFAAAVVGTSFPLLEQSIDKLSIWITHAGSIGVFIYGVANRLLIVTGLHHILNNLAWFVLGNYHGATGDVNRFFAGDPSAGSFMAGFFPVMMFGLPGACLAMWRAAEPNKRRAVGGLFLSMGMTSFLTGVTEPIEFTFMFLSPVLYAIHALLTGVSMAVMNFLGVKLGFGFSAGFIDYVLNFGLATKPLLLLPVGLTYFFVYYGVFAYCIRRFDLKTPGRNPAEEANVAAPSTVGGKLAEAEGYIEALGGWQNLLEIAACTTRLRLTLVDRAGVNEKAISNLGARGMLPVGERGLQVIIGPNADRLASEMRLAAQSTAIEEAAPHRNCNEPSNAELSIEALEHLLGGSENITSFNAKGMRAIIILRNKDRCDSLALDERFPGRWFESQHGAIHLLAA